MPAPLYAGIGYGPWTVPGPAGHSVSLPVVSRRWSTVALSATGSGQAVDLPVVTVEWTAPGLGVTTTGGDLAGVLDLTAGGSYGALGPEYEKVTGAMTVAGDGATVTAEAPWPMYDDNYAAGVEFFGPILPGPGDVSVGGLPAGWTGDDWIDGPSPGYYDLGLVLYKAYLRTGNTTYRDYARDWVDCWYKGSSIAEGTNATTQGDTHDPRHVALQGLMCRAIDGRPVIWDWIYRYVDDNFEGWIEIRRANSLAADEMENGYRPTGYMLLYTAQVARALPDSYPLVGGGTASDGAAKRADLLARLEDEMANLVLPLQQANGSWVSSEPDQHYWRSHTAIFVPLWIEGIVETYFASSDSGLKASIVSALTDYGNYVWSIYRPSFEWANESCVPTGILFRSLPYFHGGGSDVGLSDYAANGSPPYNLDCWAYSDRVRDERQIGKPWLVQLFGFLYKVSGNNAWLVKGDEWMAADFGRDGGPGSDGNYALGDYMSAPNTGAPGGKSFNQSYRSSTKYLAWRLGA